LGRGRFAGPHWEARRGVCCRDDMVEADARGNGFRKVDHAEFGRILNGALRVEHSEEVAPQPRQRAPRAGQRASPAALATKKTLVEVPFEEDVTISVKKKVHKPGFETKVVKGTELVPVKKVREVEESVVELKEEVVKGTREIWVKQLEPYEELVRKPVTVTRKKHIPYTDYVEKPVEITVQVPRDRVDEQKGQRTDRILKTKLVEAHQDVEYELRPVRVGTPRIRELSGNNHHGRIKRGTSTLAARHVNDETGNASRRTTASQPPIPATPRSVSTSFSVRSEDVPTEYSTTSRGERWAQRQAAFLQRTNRP